MAVERTERHTGVARLSTDLRFDEKRLKTPSLVVKRARSEHPAPSPRGHPDDQDYHQAESPIQHGGSTKQVALG